MLNYLINRLITMMVTLFVISILVFVIIQLPPGDYLSTYIAELEAQAQPEAMQSSTNSPLSGSDHSGPS